MTITPAAVRGRRRTAVPALLALAAIAALMATASPASARAATTPTTDEPLLAQGTGMGDHPSPAVRRVQRVLDRRGYDLGAPGVDGRFGPITDAAVRQMQADAGLTADGLVGPRTRHALGLRTTTPARTARTSTRAKKAKARQTKAHKPAISPPAALAPAAHGSSDTARDTGVSDAFLLVIGAFAALLISMLVLAIRATRSAPAPIEHKNKPAPAPPRATATGPTVVVPISHELHLEGHDDEHGDFRGLAVASSITYAKEDPDHPTTTYLVDDPRRSAPIWVPERAVRRSPSRLAAGEPVIGYVTLAAQASATEADPATEAIDAACEQTGWRLIDVVTDREAGRGLERPGLTYALRQIADGHARGLVVSDLRRLSRSIVDLGALMEWFRDAGAALVALDLGVDTSTPAGEELASTLITLGGWERERIARRTRSGLAEVRAQGGATSRPSVADRPELTERITAMRSAGMTLQAIADQLNTEQVPTLRGGTMWRPSSVQAALGYRRPGSRGPRDQLPSLEEDRQG